MKTVKTLGHNQFYFYSEDKIVFQSYNTIVCVVSNYENGNHPVIKITANQPQSKTTAKYLNRFLYKVVGLNIKSYKELSNER